MTLLNAPKTATISEMFSLRDNAMDDDSQSTLDPLLENIRWPSDFIGQQLFIQGEDWQYNAMLNWSHFRADLYAFAYKDAADGLMEAMANRKVPLDSGIYPLLFLYRHALELQLKLMLTTARNLAGLEARNYEKHSLMPMWSELRKLLKELGPNQPETEVSAVHGFIRQLNDVDPDSMAFRYATTRYGKEHLSDITHINIRHLRDVLDSIFLWLNGAYDWLGEMESNQPDY
ncbi:MULTISPECIES: hypothetical protein [unclassified Pseudomonas]|uniref:hypothetical protein n=1 Tax=unclassified Pseudomonas TaxID=196821 RepID=UPI0021140C80|nr:MULTISPECIES: hypothetical protein [unclassified Pseudomonas]